MVCRDIFIGIKLHVSQDLSLVSAALLTVHALILYSNMVCLG